MPKDNYKGVLDPVSNIQPLNDDAGHISTLPSGYLLNLTPAEQAQLMKDLRKDDDISAMAINFLNDRNEPPMEMHRGHNTKNFSNDVRHGDKILNITELGLDTGNTGKISAELATTLLLKESGLCSPHAIPLWHSGMWISFKNISEANLSDLLVSLSIEEIEIGRLTSGLIYNNLSVAVMEKIVNMAVSHLNHTSLNIKDKTKVTHYIRTKDYDTFLLGFLATIYPDGYDFIRSCSFSLNVIKETKPLDNGETEEVKTLKCNHVSEGTINLRRILFVNINSLDNKQLMHMANKGPETVTKDEVINYQNSLASNQEFTFPVSLGAGKPDIKITICDSMVKHHITCGNNWINGIIKTVDSFFTEDLSESERNVKLNNRAKLSYLNSYLHYFKKIEIKGGYVTSPEAISKLLTDVLSTNAEAFDIIRTNIIKKLDEDLISLVGIPRYVCPSCKEEQDTENIEGFEEIIPIEIFQEFLHLGQIKATELYQNLEEI